MEKAGWQVEQVERKMCENFLFVRFCLSCLLISEVGDKSFFIQLITDDPQVSLHPVSPFSSCGCLDPASVSLTDTREMSMSTSQCFGVCRNREDVLFTFDNHSG